MKRKDIINGWLKQIELSRFLEMIQRYTLWETISGCSRVMNVKLCVTTISYAGLEMKFQVYSGCTDMR